MREEPPSLSLNRRHAGCVNGREERQEPDALQDPTRCDRKHKPHGRVDSAQGNNQKQGDSQRRMLEPVGHPAVRRHGAAPHEDGRDQGDRRPPRSLDRRAPRKHDGRPAEHEQPDKKCHVQDIDARRPAPVAKLDIRWNGRYRQEGDQDPGFLATEHRQSDGLGRHRPGKRVAPHGRSRGGHTDQEMQEGDRRQERCVQLIEHEDLRAEQSGLNARAGERLGGDADIKRQPRQHGAAERQAGKRDAPAVDAVGVMDPADAR